MIDDFFVQNLEDVDVDDLWFQQDGNLMKLCEVACLCPRDKNEIINPLENNISYYC